VTKEHRCYGINKTFAMKEAMKPSRNSSDAPEQRRAAVTGRKPVLFSGSD